MLRKTIHATLIVILMMGAASAQSDAGGFLAGGNSLRDRNLEKKKSDSAIDRAYRSKQIDNDYKAATRKIPDQKPNDPWGAIRPTPTAPAPKEKQQ